MHLRLGALPPRSRSPEGPGHDSDDEVHRHAQHYYLNALSRVLWRAEALVVTERTVKGHVTNILRKLGVATRTEAAIKARELGID